MVLAGCGSPGVRTAAYDRTASPPASAAQRRITVPGSFDDYTRQTGPEADRVVQTIRDAQAKQNAAYAAKMKIGVYQRRGNAQQRIAFLGLAAGDHPAIAQELRANPPSFEVDSALAAMPLSGPKDYPPGAFGGVLRCAAGAQGGAGCAWGDGSTLGVVAGSGTSADELAKATVALRKAAER
ncbi:hypothetical protein NE235_16395 [Actinoallomurus spadix]|uniref:Lipoprotein n=1 Tax=Actinoallomurus spadix TaxID=79912 RepID=A0ABN0XH32_9ACTN|nr:hypothetical protein [Actinoallomurus spadix]MCO5987683.1 hypothetical protein [Actinoallomurus spadix]